MNKKVTVLLFTAGIFSLSFQNKFDLKASVDRGKNVYGMYCLSCHKAEGEGLEGVYPPLAKSDYLMADKARSIRQVVNGASGEMKVNGKTYNSDMVGIDLSDEELVDVLNYVRNSFGNKGDAVVPSDIKAAFN